MSAHTPGPWKAYKRKEPVGYAEWEIHWSDQGECVAEVVHEEANARLIAAAPEMYKLLKEMTFRLHGMPEDNWLFEKAEELIQKIEDNK
jgi:hypothetical protein